MIKGQATEVIDVGHFLPMAFADWFTRKEMSRRSDSQSVLLVDDSRVLPQHAGAGAEGRRLPGPHRADRAGGPGALRCADLRRGR